jgi:drug/metabolite transporter (DMT)-like permease
MRKLSRQQWKLLILLGLLLYTVTQGAQFLGLAYLPAITVSLILGCTPILVALLSMFFLTERPTMFQWGGICFYLVGVVVYFSPVLIYVGELVGFVALMAGLIANAWSSLLGRHLNREKDLHPFTITIVSMGVGAIVLLVTGVCTQGLPRLTPADIAIIFWLAVVNTAFTFVLWNHTLRTLSAMESSIINNMMLIFIAILAWLFLGERLNLQKVIGMVLAGLGILIVQIYRRKTSDPLRSSMNGHTPSCENRSEKG